MLIKVETEIARPAAEVWQLIADIENSAGFISGIEKIQVLEKPAAGIKGLKWKETRTMFGKTAEETMWITDVVEQQSYTTRAESHGALYKSTMSVKGENGCSRLSMTFEGIPQTIGAKILNFFTGSLFKGATRKLLALDLADIKSFVEKS